LAAKLQKVFEMCKYFAEKISFCISFVIFSLQIGRKEKKPRDGISFESEKRCKGETGG
jgi:hypothetical protein